MTGGFAGSRSVDERRRRRLATESEDSAATPDVDAAPAPKRKPPNAKVARRGPSHFPLRKLISVRLWKLWGVGFITLLVGTGIIVGGWLADRRPTKLGPGFQRLFDTQRAPLARVDLAALFFLSGQLALLIWWLRSQSLQDFKGRYRGWMVAAIALFATAVGIQIHAGEAWSETVVWLWPVEFWNKPALSWMVPAALCGLVVFRFLNVEMRASGLGIAMLWLAALLVLGRLAMTLAEPIPLPPLETRLLSTGVAIGAGICLFMSLLFHARYAIYFSVEPPLEKAGLILSILRRLRPRWPVSRSTSTTKTRSPVSAVRRRQKPATRSNDLPRKTEPTPADQTLTSTPAPGDKSPSQPRAASTATKMESTSSTAISGSSGATMSRRERGLRQKELRTEQAKLRRSA